jgi:hypothetical protein
MADQYILHARGLHPPGTGATVAGFVPRAFRLKSIVLSQSSSDANSSDKFYLNPRYVSGDVPSPTTASGMAILYQIARVAAPTVVDGILVPPQGTVRIDFDMPFPAGTLFFEVTVVGLLGTAVRWSGVFVVELER